ncbi:helix-turn-helix domain-containing protein [Sinorhizobium meliloti]|nr:helix-turn-helix domain-containing protein [Sinorhizobium meliloti]MQW40780.1 helix-turn-helix domain-containing protein [Sinorhizobium meliloti]
MTGERRRSTINRTGEKVRRHSRRKGRCEAVFWRPMSREDARKIVFAARRYETSTKKPGERNGALGHVALEIIDYLANLMNKNTGRLDPSIIGMMKALRRCRAAIVRGLQALREHGFLDWLRRFEPTGNAEGPQVKQATNAYRLLCPPALANLLRVYFKPAPLPGDEEQRIAELAAAVEDYRRTLSNAELPLFMMGSDDALAQALARLGAAIDRRKERESAKEPQSLI